jgi:hypothetical protein
MENKLDSNTALWDVKYISEDELKFNRQTTIPKDYIIFTSCVGYHQPEDEDDFREVFLQHDEG